MSELQVNKKEYLGYGAWTQRVETLVPLSRVLSITSNAITALEILSKKAINDKNWNLVSGIEHAKIEISVLFRRFIDLSGNQDNYQDYPKD